MRTSPWAGTAAAASVLAVALALAWPALLNGYPILFSDTQAFLVQAGQPRTIWDKPWVYGPFLEAFHGFTTLWTPLAAQALLLSLALWLAMRAAAPGAPARAHLACGLVLAAGSAAPWVASLLIPDVFAPLTVLALFVVGFSESRAARRAGGVLATLAIAAHLSHLIVAAACLAAMLPLRPRRALAVAAPLLAALAILVASNIVSYGRVAVSPFGAVFLLARLVADGPARETIAADCPEAGWRLCAWAGRLPPTSDEFLWAPDGPVWTTTIPATRGGPMALAPEAAAIVRRTVLERPGGVLRAAWRDTLAQLAMVRLGDTLTPAHFSQSVALGIAAYFPANEQARFAAGLQARGRLRAWAAPLNRPDAALLALGALATPLALAWALRRGRRPAAGLAAMVLAGVLANGVATGALSGPFDRYQARIAWLLLPPPLFAAAAWAESVRSARAARPRPAPAAPAPRTRAAAPPSPGRG